MIPPPAVKLWELQDREAQWAGYSWLELLSAFPLAQTVIRARLTHALYSETHPRAISTYLTYLLSSAEPGDISTLATEIAIMIKSRSFVVGELLQSPHIYALFLVTLITALKARPTNEQPADVMIRTRHQEHPFGVPLEILNGCLTVLGIRPPSQGEAILVAQAAELHSQLVEILFPSFVSDADSEADTQFYLSPSLQPLPLLSEDQALAFLKTSHPRLVGIALKYISYEQLLRVFARGISLSPTAANTLLHHFATQIENNGGITSIPTSLQAGLATQLRVYASFGCAPALSLLSSLSVIDEPEAHTPTFGRLKTQDPAIPLEKTRTLPSYPTEQARNLLQSALALPVQTTSTCSSPSATLLLLLTSHSLPSASSTSSFPEAICRALTESLPELLSSRLLSPTIFPTHRTSDESILGVAMSVTSLLFVHPSAVCEGSLRESLTQLVSTAMQLRENRNNLLVSLIIEYGNSLLGVRSSLAAIPEPALQTKAFSVLTALRRRSAHAAQFKADSDLILSVLFDNPQLWLGEEIIERLMLQQISTTGRPSSVVDLLLPLLSSRAVPQPAVGMLLDWLEASDPTGHALPMQKWLLSSKTQGNQFRSVQSYVVWLLINSASWARLHHYFHSTLHSSPRLTSHGCKHVLDLMTGYLNHASSWEGAMGGSKRRETDQPGKAWLYHFTPTSVSRLCEYILCENDVQNRAKLLLHAVSQGTENVHAAYQYTLSRATLYPKASSTLLLELYLHNPSHLPAPEINAQRPSSYDSHVDIIIHKLLSLLLHEDVNLCNAAYNALRHITTHHPKLLIKNLPSVGCLLFGRVHLTPREFVERRFHRLYAHVLAILDLLRPMIFQRSEVWEMMTQYFGLLEALPSSPSQAFVPLITKLVQFLCHAMEAPTPLPLLFLTHQRRHLLMEIQTQYGDIKAVEVLLDLHAIRAGGVEAFGNWEKAGLSSPSLGPSQITAACGRLRGVFFGSKQQTEETLVELSILSGHMPWLLPSFLTELLPLLRCPVSSIRKLAYKIVLKLLHHAPREGKAIVESYLSCFDDEDEEVQCEAALHLADMFPFCQGVLPYLIMKLFRLGVTQDVSAILHTIFCTNIMEE